jgi:hypothetical protein
MDSSCVWRCGRLGAVFVVGLLGFLAECYARPLPVEPSEIPEESQSATGTVREIRSRHFLIHTDLSSDEAADLRQRLEALLGRISRYWGEPPRGVIECYVIGNLEEFPVTTIAPAGACGVKTAGGITLMQVNREGKRQVAKSIVYALARLEVVQHELIHAYCHQTFSRIGPVWYSEGMAEMGRFWLEGNDTVRANAREIDFLRNNPPQSLAELLSPLQATGDCWQNYASRWALSHFLFYNPNYSDQFRRLGRGMLGGKDVSFEQTYAAVNRQLFFEYLFFLQHISPGYRVDLCAWDWRKKFACLLPGRAQKVTICAGRGWQPAGLTVRTGNRYKYLAEGNWQIAGQPQAVNADGDVQGRGRLMGVVMKDDRLGTEFEVGSEGSFQVETDGDLYLRCRNAWNALADDKGYVTVKLQCGHE